MLFCMQIYNYPMNHASFYRVKLEMSDCPPVWQSDIDHKNTEICLEIQMDGSTRNPPYTGLWHIAHIHIMLVGQVITLHIHIPLLLIPEQFCIQQSISAVRLQRTGDILIAARTVLQAVAQVQVQLPEEVESHIRHPFVFEIFQCVETLDTLIFMLVLFHVAVAHLDIFEQMLLFPYQTEVQVQRRLHTQSVDGTEVHRFIDE